MEEVQLGFCLMVRCPGPGQAWRPSEAGGARVWGLLGAGPAGCGACWVRGLPGAATGSDVCLDSVWPE